MFRKSKYLIILIVVSLFSFSSVALASTYGVMAVDNSALGIAAYGTNGYNYVMSSPTISAMHVSSLYVQTSGNMAEVGWHATAGYPYYKRPYFFAAWVKNGYYNDYDIALAPAGTNHSYTVRNITGTNTWIWYVDGVSKLTKTLSFQKGYSEASSERDSLGDTNYSHFWSLRKRNSVGNWYAWTNLIQIYDNDPDYYLRKISNTACYMQR